MVRVGLFLAMWLAPVVLNAQEFTATLTLDGLSYIAFSEDQNWSLPVGSTIQFQFSRPDPTGSSPFVIRPDGVSIPPIVLKSTAEKLFFSLGGPATGAAHFDLSGAAKIEMDATIVVRLEHPTNSGSRSFRMRFTTEVASAPDLEGTHRVTVAGARLDPSARAVRLVGATTNAADDYPGARGTTHAVLNGVFDQLPSVRRSGSK